MINFNLEYLKENSDYIYQAPARINLIGEHIDYNGGLVLPACVNLYLKAYVKKREDNKIRLQSQGFKNVVEVDLNHLQYNPRYKWAVYVIGSFYILKYNKFDIPYGLDIYFESDIPPGSGLSSSAAIIDVTLFLISDVYNLNISRLDITKYAKKVENDYCCLKSGIMDQAIIALGKKNNALLLDCNKIEYSYKNMILDDYSFLILKTNKPRKLTESKYNERVDECGKALNIIKNKYNVNNLCELNPDLLDDIKSLLNNEILFKRVKHVITEQDRVNRFSIALENGDINTLAKLLNESHESLKNDYEVTGIHLDTIVEAAINSGAIGARMTGAGFGGCAIALIKKDKILGFKEKVISYYEQRLNIIPDVYIIDIVDGVNRIK